jgi:hypothetical protein
MGEFPVLRMVSELDHLLEASTSANHGFYTTDIPETKLEDSHSQAPEDDDSFEQHTMFSWGF